MNARRWRSRKRKSRFFFPRPHQPPRIDSFQAAPFANGNSLHVLFLHAPLAAFWRRERLDSRGGLVAGSLDAEPAFPWLVVRADDAAGSRRSEERGGGQEGRAGWAPR